MPGLAGQTAADAAVLRACLARLSTDNAQGAMPILCLSSLSPGSLITKATDALYAAGAAEVVIAATHAVLSGPAVDRLKNRPVRAVVVTNSRAEGAHRDRAADPNGAPGPPLGNARVQATTS